MRRREFIKLLGGAAAAWPIAARAQQPTPVVGLLSGVSAAETPSAAYREGLKESGFVEGQNVAFESRFADGQYDRLPALASELVNKRVAVIATMGENAAKAAQGASGGVTPVVFAIGDDPVTLGLVASLTRRRLQSPMLHCYIVTFLSSQRVPWTGPVHGPQVSDRPRCAAMRCTVPGRR